MARGRVKNQTKPKSNQIKPSIVPLGEANYKDMKVSHIPVEISPEYLHSIHHKSSYAPFTVHYLHTFATSNKYMCQSPLNVPKPSHIVLPHLFLNQDHHHFFSYHLVFNLVLHNIVTHPSQHSHIGISHLLNRSWEWKGGIDGNCFNESYPIEGPYWGTGSNLDIMKIVKVVLGKLKHSVRVLNITQMSEFRKDAHSSVYGEHGGKLLNKEQRFHPETYADCIHWCLPGVPDAWNEILYAMLLQDYRAR